MSRWLLTSGVLLLIFTITVDHYKFVHCDKDILFETKTSNYDENNILEKLEENDTDNDSEDLVIRKQILPDIENDSDSNTESKRQRKKKKRKKNHPNRKDIEIKTPPAFDDTIVPRLYDPVNMGKLQMDFNDIYINVARRRKKKKPEPDLKYYYYKLMKFISFGSAFGIAMQIFDFPHTMMNKIESGIKYSGAFVYKMVNSYSKIKLFRLARWPYEPITTSISTDSVSTSIATTFEQYTTANKIEKANAFLLKLIPLILLSIVVIVFASLYFLLQQNETMQTKIKNWISKFKVAGGGNVQDANQEDSNKTGVTDTNDTQVTLKEEKTATTSKKEKTKAQMATTVKIKPNRPPLPDSIKQKLTTMKKANKMKDTKQQQQHNHRDNSNRSPRNNRNNHTNDNNSNSSSNRSNSSSNSSNSSSRKVNKSKNNSSRHHHRSHNSWFDYSKTSLANRPNK